MDKINLNLFTSIKTKEKEYEYNSKDKLLPVEHLIKDNQGRNIYLYGEGGIGKTMIVKTLLLRSMTDPTLPRMIFIPCKELNIENKNENSIYKYIYTKYGFDLNQVSINKDKILILLDAVNEAPQKMIASQNVNLQDKFSILERDIIEVMKKYSVLITSRSRAITVNGEEQERDFVLGEVLVLSNEQLNGSLKGKGVAEGIRKLISNNMMLSLYLEAEKYGLSLSNDCTAFELLQKYFQICMKSRYVFRDPKIFASNKTFIQDKLDSNDTIEKGYLLLLNSIGQLWDDDSDHILGRSQRYDRAKNILIENVFAIDEIKDQVVLEKLCEMQLLTKSGENTLESSRECVEGGIQKNFEIKKKYSFLHEIYQQYFEVLHLVRLIENNQWKFFSERLGKLIGQVGSHTTHYYFVAQCVGEYLKNKNVFDKIDELNFDYVPRFVLLAETLGKMKYKNWKGKKIGPSWFFQCMLLESISLPNSVDAIDAEAFRGCKNLKDVHFPENLKRFARSAFMGCSSLESIIIPDNIAVLPESLFSDCTSLKKFVKNYNCHDIEIQKNCFKNCISLSFFDFSDVEIVERDAFIGCKKLKEIKLSDDFEITELESAFDRDIFNRLEITYI